MRPTLVLLAILLPAAAYLLPPPARAAQSYDSCTGFIDSLPAVISTQGTWCLRRDLTTAITSGSAININANNVTIDCNGFKVGGLAAGKGSYAYGFRADGRQNASVRNCSIRGFFLGAYLSGAGHVLEDNRLDGNLTGGLHLAADSSLVRRNWITDTGRHVVYGTSVVGIYVGSTSEVSDNVISGVYPSGDVNNVRGVVLAGYGNLVRGNTVRGLRAMGEDSLAYGIQALFPSNRIEYNDLAGADAGATYGISAIGQRIFCGRNTISGFQQAMATSCIDTGGNVHF